MKKLITGFVVYSLLFLIVLVDYPVFAWEEGAVHKTGDHIHRFSGSGWERVESWGVFPIDPDTISLAFRDEVGQPDRSGIFSSFGCRVKRISRLGTYDVEISEQSDPIEVVERLLSTGLFKYVETNTIGRYTELPNDPDFDQQWGPHNTGGGGCTEDADVDAPEAWDTETGDPLVVVCIMDSGTEVSHQDLANNIWVNEGEIPNNGEDDDENGYIDDYWGWDFENNNGDPTGSYFHGTHVAGIVGAETNNGMGISGVAGGWGGPGCKLMIAQVGNTSPIGEILDEAIIWSVELGARIITLSLTVGQSTPLEDAVEWAVGEQGVFIDCASGNNYGAVAYPASISGIVAVGATDCNDNRASFSNYGPELELTAPGVDVYSTQLGNSYGSSDGTSFASPHVAGAAALIWSYAPGLTNQEVREQLWNSADDLGTVGWDQYFGYGRINLETSLQGLTSVLFDRVAYQCEDTLFLTVYDRGASGSVNVIVKSGTEPGGETVTLSESEPGLFEGVLSVSEVAPQGGDGIISVVHGDTIHGEYPAASSPVEAGVDCESPVISDVSVEDVTFQSAVVTWNTDEPTDTRVLYGFEIPPAMEVFDTSLTFSHAITLPSLEPCTRYYFSIEVQDTAGNTTVDDNSGDYYRFMTKQLATLLEESLNSDPGWATSGGLWSFGVPTGNGGQYGGPDPTSGYTGYNVYGYNLNGDYENYLPEYHLTSDPFTCSGYSGTKVRFYRWLGVETNTFDHASFSVSNDGGSFHTVWFNPDSETYDGSWVEQEYDISEWADDQETVYLRWTMGATDEGWTYCGWNIDDILVYVSTECATPTPLPTSTATPTATFTATPSPTVTQTCTNVPDPTATPTSTPTIVPTSVPSATVVPTKTPVFEPTATPQAGERVLELNLNFDIYHGGDSFLMTSSIYNPNVEISVDEYIILDVFGNYWFWPTWKQDVSFTYRVLESWTVYPDEEILSFTWPSSAGSESGIVIWGALARTGTYDLVCDVVSVSFSYE